MSYTWIQTTTYTGASATSITTPSASVTAGDTLLLVCQSNTSALTVTCTTSKSDTVTPGPQGIGVPATSGWLYSFYVQSAIGGSTTVNFSSTSNLYNGHVDEYSGLGAFIGSVSTATSGGSAGANTIQSGNINVTPVPAFLWGCSTDPNFINVPSAGTSPIAFTGRTSVSKLVTEDAAIAVAGNAQATFGTPATTSYPALAMAFQVAAQVGAPFAPFGGQAKFFVNERVVQF